MLVNALIHRDYLVSASIRLFIFDDRIEIISPGHLPNNLTVEKIKAGNSNIRNPILVSYAAKGLLPYHGLGSGITRALRSWPHIDFIDDHEGCLFKAVIRRIHIPAQEILAVEPVKAEKILAILSSNPKHTVSQLAAELGVTSRTVERTISVLRKEGRLHRVGPPRGGRWEVVL